MRRFYTFDQAIASVGSELLNWGAEVDTGHWQGVTTEGRPDMVTKEIRDICFTVPMPGNHTRLQEQIRPNLPWADDHFAERVSGDPTNPGFAYKTWPWWQGQDDATKLRGKFTHTYQERFWPKFAGSKRAHPKKGIRYPYGDLQDVVNMLRENRYTRQAYLPIFFPEDTGAVHGGRIPCTLGYHFLVRNEELHMWYFIRSCDYVRHFRDDLYLAARLQLWVMDKLGKKITPGTFNFHCISLHVHKGDLHLVTDRD